MDFAEGFDIVFMLLLLHRREVFKWITVAACYFNYFSVISFFYLVVRKNLLKCNSEFNMHYEVKLYWRHTYLVLLICLTCYPRNQ